VAVNTAKNIEIRTEDALKGYNTRSPAKGSYCHFACLTAIAVLLCGCTCIKDYVHKGFKVGPNYAQPAAAVSPNWIDASDKRVRNESDDLCHWWTVFNDPALDSLICCAYRQNLSLREAGFRVLEARAQLGITTGNLFPQSQFMSGDFTRGKFSTKTAGQSTSAIVRPFFDQWDYGFTLNWELDFWGRFRRAIESNSDLLDASVEDYDDILVTLLGDVATNYVQLRTLQKRIEYAQANVDLQRETLIITEARFKAGTTSELDVYQARSTLEQTEAQIPELEIALRQANNQICILLGIPPEELQVKLGPGSIPTAPPEVAVGIPADLLRRRPDVRRAERQAAAQCAQIGVAEADFYPSFSIDGTIGYSAERFPDLFVPAALRGNVGPTFQWKLLNYGRILNNVHLQDAKFQELAIAYQNAILIADQEVENGLVTYLRAQERAKYQTASVDDAEKAVKLALAQYKAGTVDFTRVTQVEQALVLQQDTLMQALGEIATGLIQVYEALGGGWQIRCTGCEPGSLPPQGETNPPLENIPVPNPMPVPQPDATLNHQPATVSSKQA
jgi:NodT family efflux transporter outer membrane factor (OMF) lipoprotein